MAEFWDTHEVQKNDAVLCDLRGNLVDPASSHMLVSMIKPCMRCVIFSTGQRSAHEGGGNFVGGRINRIIMTTSRLTRGARATPLLALLALIPQRGCVIVCMG